MKKKHKSIYVSHFVPILCDFFTFIIAFITTISLIPSTVDYNAGAHFFFETCLFSNDPARYQESLLWRNGITHVCDGVPLTTELI